MTAFDEAYKQLNAAQKQAVDTIDGPLLVIAGPGTGKTQLLSARVANILRQTDTPAANILCLTFTEAGAGNMRERLTRFIGQEAYDVNIGTYHAFGSDLIQRYPEYFWESRLQNPIDELSKQQLLLEIVEAMSFKNPLRQSRHHIGDLISTISDVKRALLTSDDLRAIAAENLAFITAANKLLPKYFESFKIMPRSFDKAAPYFEKTLRGLAPLVPEESVASKYEPLGKLCVSELLAAYEDAQDAGKTKPLTVWKNKWLAKNADNQFIIAGELENYRIQALADTVDAYQAALEAQGLYDFDDMILRSIAALEQHADLRYSLQERYMYILLDEFQDTNAAQLRLIQLLTDNPVNENRPNILAVGDDDQAIYAFQGAQYSNMIEFYEMYTDTQVINLTDNYRSHADILLTAHNLARQIGARLTNRFEGVTKQLLAANPTIQASTIQRREFQSDISERAWIASEIKKLIDNGVPASEIAVLAPKHRIIEPLVPYLNNLAIPVRYEKRENILDAPVVRQLITMSQLVLAIAADKPGAAGALWPQVLSYNFWEIPTADIWRLSWAVSDSRGTDTPISWNQAVLDSPSPLIRRAAMVILTAASETATENLETMLDYLIGSASLQTHAIELDDEIVSSPLREYYTSRQMQHDNPELFYETLSHLTVLRARLREYQNRSDSALSLADFVRFIGMYEAAEQPMINTSPYAQAAESVQLLTVFKAKGLEYSYVFIPASLDDVWGSASRGNTNKLTIPANLQPIRHAGATDDERLRILFVAITRAKHGLYLTSSSRTFGGKATPRLKYFDEQQQQDGHFRAMVLPEQAQSVITDDHEAPAAELLALDWQTRHIGGLKSLDLAGLLRERLENMQLTATDIVTFLDVEYGGPEKFFFERLLRFPTAPTIDSQFGNAIHETLEWCQHQTNEHGFAPGIKDILAQFEQRMTTKKLTEKRTLLEIERGRDALTAYFKKRGEIFQPGAIVERSFRNEGVFCGDAHLGGRIDRMEIDNANKTIVVVDYKTGKGFSSWRSDTKLHKNELQLYLYKILIEGSKTYRGYKVTQGRLEFIEPDADGTINTLTVNYDKTGEESARQLVAAIWDKIRKMEFPDTSKYPATVKGIQQFEAELLGSSDSDPEPDTALPELFPMA